MLSLSSVTSLTLSSTSSSSFKVLYIPVITVFSFAVATIGILVACLDDFYCTESFADAKLRNYTVYIVGSWCP